MTDASCNRRQSIFIRMSDRQDVVDFVKEIEKYQCLYDQNSMQYSNKLLKRRTWVDIAKKYNSSVPDCKEKWRKIRIAYMRYLKMSKSANPPSRPYYLANYLHFISPNNKADDNMPTNSTASPAPSEVSVKLEIDESDHLADIDDDMDDSEQDIAINLNETRKENKNININRHINRSVSMNVIEDRLNKERNGVFDDDAIREMNFRRSNDNIRPEYHKNCLNDENNPRRMFLMSLLPDIETLNEQEMRSFRREVIALLDRIMATRESVIVTVPR